MLPLSAPAAAAAQLVGGYYLDEAPAGTGPVKTYDAAASPLDLNLTYGGASGLSYTHLNRNRGIASAGTGHSGWVGSGVAGSKFATQIGGSQTATFVAVASFGAGQTDNGRIAGFEYGADESAAAFAVSPGGRVRFRFRPTGGTATQVLEWSTGYGDGTRRVYHLVWETSQSSAANRARLYVNGAVQAAPTVVSGALPGKNATLDFSQAGLQLAVANRPTGGRAISGSVHYLGVYRGVLAATTIASQASALLANDDDRSMALTLTPRGTETVAQLPSNGVRYRQSFRLVNGSSDWEYFDLKARPGAPGSSFIAIDSVGGSGAGAAVAGDSARTVVLAPGTAADLTVTYRTVGGTVGGLDSLYLTGTSVTDHTTPRASEQGWVYVRLAEARMTLAKAVATTGPRIPGMDLAYTITLANAGSKDAAGVVVIDQLPPQLLLKIGGAQQTLPGSLTATLSYSSDAGASWSYTPVSGGCAAPAGYDGCANRVRWTVQGSFPSGGSSQGTLTLTTRIR